MNEAIKTMLEKYNCQSTLDYENALKEIFQEIALLGLWRSKFFEHAAFYGGSALRILYGLDRFSEDLDFTLLKPDKNFDFKAYSKAIEAELKSFGFHVEVSKREKNQQSKIESAFIKANTWQQMILIDTPITLMRGIQKEERIKIKLEIDTGPPTNFSTTVEPLLLPIPSSVKVLTKPDLFGGKIHALLCRPWQKRVKGRDWYDFIWYIAREIPVNLIHLQQRLYQSNAWDGNELTLANVKKLLLTKIEETDFENAKKDIIPFIKSQDSLSLWSHEFFNSITQKLLAL